MTSRKRTASDEERRLFEETLKDARPLSKRKRPARSAAPAKSAAAASPSVPLTVARKTEGSPGLDGNTAGRLTKGELKPEAKLDLHGMTEEVAHRALVTFLRAASARKLRLLLIITGKGKKQPRFDEPFDLELESRARGVLRTMTPRWLAEPALAGFVADVRASHRRHGGDGALYVYLRKPR
jgi:DNA-nicking Smr family endonuclease